MDENLVKTNYNLKWENGFPFAKKRIAVLIPQYNESLKPNFIERLEYFAKLALKEPKEIDVILIDDGSIDESFDLTKCFLNHNPETFFLAKVTPNSQKVRALFLVASVIKHEYVVLTDFDTRLENLALLGPSLDNIDLEKNIMGCYFKMIPVGSSGLLLYFQRFEYAFVRMKYKSFMKEKSVSIMPGAGCCYKRELLIEIHKKHSGELNGEDRESAVIGQKLGYKSIYAPQIHAMTSSPKTISNLYEQRKRWKLGFVKTIIKKRRFYFKSLLNCKKTGIQIFKDIIRNLVIMLLPFEIVILSLIDPSSIFVFLIGAYLLVFFRYMLSFVLNPDERIELNNKGSVLILYPAYLFLISFFPLWHCFFVLMKKKAS